MHERTGIHDPACMLLLLLLAAVQQPAAAASSSSSSQQQPAGSSQQQQHHASRFMDAGSFMHACQLLLMRACVLRAYCKKCRVHIVLERVGRSNMPVLIPVDSSTLYFKRQVHLTGQRFRALYEPGIFYSTHAARTHASAAAGMHA